MTRLFLTVFLVSSLPLAAQTPPKARAVDDAPQPPKAPPVSEPAPPKASPVSEPAPPKAVSAPPKAVPAAPPKVEPPAAPVEEVTHSGQFAPQPPETEVDTIVRIQIHLDEKMNGPGYIDGRIGEFGKKAASVYNQIRGIPVGNWHPLIEASAKAVPNPYTTYTIQASDVKYITPTLPSKPQDQEKVKYLGYRSLLEFVSERFHTSEPFLQWLNKGENLNNLDPGDSLKVPNVTPFKLEEWPKHRAFEKEPVLSAHTVAVDIAARVAIFFDENNKPCASFPITPGEDRFIKFGEWQITNMVSTPEFRWDKSMLEEGKRSSNYYQLPIGPNSPVGILWTGTSRTGIGLHGTSTPHTIGRSASKGCIRFANWDAVRLPTLVRPGARLVIR
jgi:lipoprotein-anchoring transpeptidase ErfK/SrfK